MTTAPTSPDAAPDDPTVSVFGREVAYKHIVAFVYVSALFVDILDVTIVNVALPTLGREFRSDAIEWIVLGYTLGGVLRGLGVAATVTAVALVFTRLHVAHLLVTASVIVLTAFVFSLGGLINAILADNFDDVSIIPSFVLTPLSYLGGVFYSIALLPEFAQRLSLFNPILYMVNAFRYGMLGVADVGLGTAFAGMLGFAGVLFATCMVLIGRGTGIRS